MKQETQLYSSDVVPPKVVDLNSVRPGELERLLELVERISYAGHGFRWHLSSLVDMLHVLSGCDKSQDYRRNRTCLDDTSCRFCGSADGHVRSKLIDFGNHEREVWTGKRWERR